MAAPPTNITPPKDEHRTALPPPPEIQVQILEELKTLVQLQHQAASKSPIITEFVWNTLLQVLGLVAAALFGAFSVLAWRIGRAANELGKAANDLASKSNSLGSDSICLSGVANWLSLAAYCQSGSNTSFCSRFDSDYSDYIDGLYRFNLEQATGCSTTGSSDDSGEANGALSGSTIAGIVLGVVLAVALGVAVFYLPFATYRTRLHRSEKTAHSSERLGQ